MTTKQHQNHLAKVSAASFKESDNTGLILTGSNDPHACLANTESSVTASQSLSIEEAGIQSVPQVVLKQMWQKAGNLLSQQGLVMDGPCSSSNEKRYFIVASKSSGDPHIIQQQ